MTVPGSCGELVQGWTDGRLLQITCPIDRFSTAEVSIESGRGTGVHAPGGYEKARAAVEHTLERLGLRERRADLGVASALLRGKGMGSSTADVVAAAAATVAAALDTLPSPELLAEVAISVEPSDGTMFSGITLFDHREGSLHMSLGPPPPLRILVIDPGGTVDTLTFNGLGATRTRRAMTRVPADRIGRWTKAFHLVRDGIRSGDIEAVGRGATESAVMHQEVLANPLFPEILQVARDAGAVGVNRAHSGTVVGLLFPIDTDGPEAAEDMLHRRGLPVEGTLDCRLVGGGARAASRQVARLQ